MKRSRVIGTSEEAIKKEESSLNRNLPPSFREWLLKNNGLDIEGVHIYPIRDERDVRKTWESLTHNLENGWAAWLENFEEEEMDFSHLLPFADYGTGDYYCFDYSSISDSGECPIVRWSHETGETEFRANDFTELKKKILAGDFEYD
jgi:hypothetical protein